ncbi:MAG: hypothetical protein ACMV0Y_06365 [Paludibacter sp.]
MASVDIDIEDYLDEVDTDTLIEELKTRKDLPKEWHDLKKLDDSNDILTYNEHSRTPKRDLILEILGLNEFALIEEAIESLKQLYK